MEIVIYWQINPNLFLCLMYSALHSEAVLSCLLNYLAVYVSSEEVTIPSGVQQQSGWKLLLQTSLYAPRPHPVSHNDTTNPVFLFLQWPPRGRNLLICLFFVVIFNYKILSELLIKLNLWSLYIYGITLPPWSSINTVCCIGVHIQYCVKVSDRCEEML